ncbi:MAG: hypothetical protein AABX23_03500 [Nanoarchaeota archaeon]
MMVYHGTSVENAISIAGHMEIRSPLEQERFFYQDRTNQEDIKMVLDRLTRSYGKQRAMSVYFTSDLDSAVGYAKKSGDEGVVFGIELDGQILRKTPKSIIPLIGSNRNIVIPIPKKVKLREPTVYIPRETIQRKHELERAFSKRVNYKILD